MIPDTPVVREALEDRRQQIDYNLSPAGLMVKLGFKGGADSPPDALDTIEQFKAECRKLGALDQICAEIDIDTTTTEAS